MKALLMLILFVGLAQAESITVDMSNLTTGQKLGTVLLEDTIYGLLISPKLKNLTPGKHGFHIHEGSDCRNAGGHFDPEITKTHAGPYQKHGHKGDLPVLHVKADGNAIQPMLAPKLTLKEIINRTLMIHQGEDNYQDSPKPNGGGGARLGCGQIK